MRNPSSSCEACGSYADRTHPNYHHIHDVDQLPRARTGEIERGYAVEPGGGIPTTWVFFPGAGVRRRQLPIRPDRILMPSV